MPIKQQGSFYQADFFQNLRGLNVTDSPFVVDSSQAVKGYNYDYLATGGISKRNGHTLLNTGGTDAQLQTLNVQLYNTYAGVKTLLRAAGTKIQTVNINTGVCTNIAEDTLAAATNFFISTTSPVVSSQFNTTSNSFCWFAGGGQGTAKLNGYTGSQVTANGVPTASGSISTAATGADGTIPAGTYYYSVSLHKLSTGAIGNAALDKPVVVGATNHVTITLSGITGVDTTKYDLFYIYRSIISGVSGFTTGDLAGTTSTASTTFTDLGGTQGTAASIPRAGNIVLDNTTLSSYSSITSLDVLTVWKRRLVTASGSTLYFSDLNKPESWPTNQTITLPSGGNITALAIISFSTSQATSDEYLAVFKERECWIVTGSNFATVTNSDGVVLQQSDIALKFVDYVGCIAQPLCVFANGFLFWIDYRGVYLWDGSGKPVYISRLIEFDFGSNDGDIDKPNLFRGNGGFFRKQNQIIWNISSATLGIQKLALKLDMRLTLGNITTELVGRVLEGVFIKDSLTYPIYAGVPVLSTSDEMYYAGDNAGNIFKQYDNPNSDNGNAVMFSYRTRPEDFGFMNVTKRFHKVVVWCRASTTNSLGLNYWVNYNVDLINNASTSQSMSQSVQVTTQVTNGIWDQGTWDNCYWDQRLVTYIPVVYNLGNASIGVEGDALTLEFTQSNINTPLIIAGYTVFFTLAGVRK